MGSVIVKKNCVWRLNIGDSTINSFEAVSKEKILGLSVPEGKLNEKEKHIFRKQNMQFHSVVLYIK